MVETEADEPTVKKTLGELNKEGKNLPSPAPEAVQTWVETEKFATQYNPKLTDHDRHIQLNRLNKVETENVSGGHFHAWKNLKKAVRSKFAQKVAAAGLLVGMSVSLAGCFANGNTENNNGGNPAPTPSTSASAPAPASYGMVIGSGEKVKTADGTYETIDIDKNSPLYNFNNGEGNPDYMAEAGWTEADGKASQKVVANYLVKEFVDSSALETGDKGYQEWHKTSAKKYYSGEIYQQLGASPDSNVVLGNFAGADKIPALIHDDTPREKELNLEVTGFMPYSDERGVKGIMYTVKYDAAYRVSDANATKFAASHTGKTPEEFLKSSMAKPSLKDGKGENIYRPKGLAEIVVGKDAKK
jgi:hypothetical protein